MKLPPILDIIRGYSELEYRMFETIRKANMPQTLGLRTKEYTFTIINGHGSELLRFADDNGTLAWNAPDTSRIDELESRVKAIEDYINLMKP
jgi:hypothetical protein